jgi:putative acetyltransferase
MAVADNGVLTVEVFKKNAIGRRFYESYGFRALEELVHESSSEETIRMSYTPR